jgi:hypothetical protein
MSLKRFPNFSFKQSKNPPNRSCAPFTGFSRCATHTPANKPPPLSFARITDAFLFAADRVANSDGISARTGRGEQR